MLKITTVKPLSEDRLWVEMNDGRSGEFDVTPYMQSAFFSQLKNETYFAKVQSFFSGIGWPDGQDLGPDTVAAALELVPHRNAA